jgi:hypothetical protein
VYKGSASRTAYNITIRCCCLDNEFERGPVGRWCDAHSIVREPIDPMRTIRMESLKEPIVRFEKGPHLWYKKRPSLDKYQRLSRRKALSFCLSRASPRASGPDFMPTSCDALAVSGPRGVKRVGGAPAIKQKEETKLLFHCWNFSANYWGI